MLSSGLVIDWHSPLLQVSAHHLRNGSRDNRSHVLAHMRPQSAQGAPGRGFQLDCVEPWCHAIAPPGWQRTPKTPQKTNKEGPIVKVVAPQKGLLLAWRWTTAVRRLWLEAKVLVMENVAG